MEWTRLEKNSEGYDVIQLVGDCDLYHAPKFATAMLQLIEGGALRLKLDLSGVKYLDSTGVGALIRILQAVKRRGGDIRFSGITGSPRKVLQMSNILPLMKEDDQPGGRP